MKINNEYRKEFEIAKANYESIGIAPHVTRTILMPMQPPKHRI